jgi:hypothetical protein
MIPTMHRLELFDKAGVVYSAQSNEILKWIANLNLIMSTCLNCRMQFSNSVMSLASLLVLSHTRSLLVVHTLPSRTLICKITLLRLFNGSLLFLCEYP